MVRSGDGAARVTGPRWTGRGSRSGRCCPGGIMRRIIRLGIAVAGIAGLLLLGAPAALAGGNGAQTFTQHDHNLTSVSADFNPCTGDPGTLTETVNDIFHGTINKTGSWFTGTI